MANVFNKQRTKITSGNPLTDVYSGQITESILTQLDIANVSSVALDIDIAINDGATDYYLGVGIELPVGSTLQYIAGQKIVLSTTETLKVEARGGSGIVAHVNVAALDDVNG